MEEVRLTEFSHGAGCGCKIAPAVLEEILKTDLARENFSRLIVGNDTRDDAAVYDLNNGNALISTADFFTPVVDDAFDFGRIASANAISDVYAMGGNPVLAIAILGWPVSKIPVAYAQRVIEGARAICKEAGIPLAGGHSIDTPEPVFGLSVNGLVETRSIKKNSAARQGDIIFLSKKIGTGILTTAQKRKILLPEHDKIATDQMIILNKDGAKFGGLPYIHAVTDVTGFGLLGHLIEMTEGSNLSAEISYNAIPLLDGVKHYLTQFVYPDNTMRNWTAFQDRTDGISGESLLVLCDPQTNGGLLVAVDPKHENDFREEEKNADFIRIGEFISAREKRVYIK